MTTGMEGVCDFVVGNRTVGEALEQAVADGTLVRHEDGRFEIASCAAGQPFQLPTEFPWIIHRPVDVPVVGCAFMNRFLFQVVYAQSAVPYGCRACFKVKVVSRSLRELMAVNSIAEGLPFIAKCMCEVENRKNPHPYGSYFYFFDGLEHAREAYATIREQVDAHPALGPAVTILIKRGCTNYERKCGPSDQYTFDPALEAVEAALEPRFVKPVLHFCIPVHNALARLEMIRTAYRIGDETYKDFTGGKDLLPPTKTYAPKP